MGVALLSAIVRLDDNRTPVVACPSYVRSGRFRAPIIDSNVGGEKRFSEKKGESQSATGRTIRHCQSSRDSLNWRDQQITFTLYSAGRTPILTNFAIFAGMVPLSLAHR